eukprot:CAMPEP_0185759670 /NCGR_PEP_ID=MMETSP1174-20130828/18432_1 /TAXON_ID=35687 /ORGANISM="Dictyocha speculum, Strain CCMP1381" /LENGTH=202 /DNA_ID=CAMNT_0028440115 /DNA_START=60 /DNA_END=668 /DNA_ORIENTATION=+
MFILCVKSPFSWAVSMHRSPFHKKAAAAEGDGNAGDGSGAKKANLTEFLRSPWETYHTILGKEKKPIRELYPSVAALRTEKLLNHLSVRARVRHFHVLRYEDVLSSPEQSIMGILALHGISMARSSFVVYDRVMKASGSTGPTTAKFEAKDSDYYLSHRYMAHFNQEAYEVYSTSLNHSLEHSLGYSIPLWTDVVGGRRGGG